MCNHRHSVNAAPGLCRALLLAVAYVHSPACAPVQDQLLQQHLAHLQTLPQHVADAAEGEEGQYRQGPCGSSVQL